MGQLHNANYVVDPFSLKGGKYMKKAFHKLLSAIVSFMLVITASFVPGLFNLSIANAAGSYEADSGVYELLGTSTNDHTDAYYIWEHDGMIFVAVTVNVNENQLNDIQMNGISADSIDYLGKSVLLKVYATGDLGGTPILDVAPPAKTSNNPNSWVIAGFDASNLPSSFLLSVLTPGGHAITNVSYTVKGALDVYHEYPPTSPELDETQSFGSNTLGGIATGTYTFNPAPTLGFEYTSVDLVIDGVVVATAVEGTALTYPFEDGTISVSESGVITLTLTKTSSKTYDFIYSYQLSDYLLTIVYEYEDGTSAATDYTETLNYQDPYSVVSPSITGFTPDVATVSGTMPAMNRTVTVTYTAIDYSFTFDPNWGSEVNEVRSFNIGGSVTPPTFTRDGYTFTGWTTDEAGLNLYVDGFTNLSAGDKTVYAQWSAIDYTFTFVPNWGSEVDVDRTFNIGGSVTPPTFTRTGFTFTGWALDAEGTMPYTQFTNLPSGDKTVYAQWSQNDYNFTFDPNWGSEINVIQSFNFGGSVAGTTFTRTGYTFTGWTTDEAGLIAYTGGLTNLPAEDIYVYAQWTAIDYDFTFDPNFGDGANVVQTFNVGGSVAGTTFTRTGYTFAGWTTDEAGLVAYTGGLTDLPAEDIYVYAQWTAIDYDFTFDPNFGDGANVVQTFNVGGSVAGTTFTRTGYTFAGWTTDEAGLIAYTGGLTNLPAEDIYVYAQWTAIDYDFTFDPNFGDGANVVQTFNVGGSVAGTTFTRTGYTFAGWTTDEAGLVAYTGGLTDLPAEDIYVYAQWTAIDYNFTFDPNFGDGANVVQTFNVGGSVAGTVFVREGFTFDGWTLDEAGLIDYVGGLTDLPAEDIYVYAQWAEVLGEEDETFVLHFVTNMPGLSFTDVVFSAGDAIVPPAPTMEGYVFLGWFIDEEFEELFDFTNMPASDVTVFADWGEVLGDDDEIPQTNDTAQRSLAFFLFILGLLAITVVKKEEELAE
jgi:uncharacterized repeat protein (TIGR02543 family)